MFQLYYAPGACSLAVHIALRQASLPHQLQWVRLKEGEHLKPGYEQIHPLRRVPALRLENGRVLTEVTAILHHLASQADDPNLLPTSGDDRSWALEWMGMLSAAVHPAFWGYLRPERVASDDAAKVDVRATAPARFFDMLRHVDTRLSAGGAALVDKYSFLGAYTFVFYLWGFRVQLPVQELPAYSRLVLRMLDTEAAQVALRAEGLAEVAAELRAVAQTATAA